MSVESHDDPKQAAGPGSTSSDRYSDADPAKKLSLLKKAVLTLTKQKQELETINQALSDKLATLGEALTKASETENDLRQELAAAQEEVAALKRALKEKASGGVGAALSATAAGVASLKGFLGGSSSPAATTPGGSGRARSHSDTASGGAAMTSSTLDASATVSGEDHQRLFQENEALHMQLFDMRTAHEAARKADEAKRKELEAKAVALEKQLAERAAQCNEHSRLLEAMTDEAEVLRATDLFCRAFLVLQPPPQLAAPAQAAVSSPTSFHPRDAATVFGTSSASLPRAVAGPITVNEAMTKGEVPVALAQTSCRTMDRVCESVEILTSSVIAIVVASKEIWSTERNSAPTSTSIASTTTATTTTTPPRRAVTMLLPINPEVQQLRAHLDSMVAKRDVLLAKLKSLRDLTVRESRDHTFYSHVELEVLQCMEDWVATLPTVVETVVEGSIALVGRGKMFVPLDEVDDRAAHHHSSAATPPPIAAPSASPLSSSALAVDSTSKTLSSARGWSRDVLVDWLVHHLKRNLLRFRGILRTLQVLVAKRGPSHHIPSQVPSWSCLWLDVLLYVHREADDSDAPSTDSTVSLPLREILMRWSNVVSHDRVRLALQTIASTIGASVGAPLQQLFHSTGRAPVKRTGTASSDVKTSLSANASTSNGVDSVCDRAEIANLVALLLQADAVALDYYTQLQHALYELVERRSEVLNLRESLHKAEDNVRKAKEETRSVSESFEEQIRVLSERLIGASSGQTAVANNSSHASR